MSAQSDVNEASKPSNSTNVKDNNFTIEPNPRHSRVSIAPAEHVVTSKPPSDKLPIQPVSQVTQQDRSIFVFPRPIAVKRDAWRYSVDAATDCDYQREKHRYSFHGDDFKNLNPIPVITDPDVLAKIDRSARVTILTLR
jgi:hypothetical protein